jgi:hypothetical protein
MWREFENKRVTSNINTHQAFQIHGMQDVYLNVAFHYHAKTWNGAIPLISKYHGISIFPTSEDFEAWINDCYIELDPSKNALWQNTQRQYWDNKSAYATKAVFDALNGTDDTTKWQCRKCGPVPQSNPQPAARIKALKQDGYYIATKKMDCPTCGGRQFFDLLVRLPQRAADNEKRNRLSEALKRKIKEVLPLVDVCFDEPHIASELVIDHKFPSSRWVSGETVNQTSMPEDEIRRKFQLLTNQTNLQKERYCRRCVLTGKRGDFFGIKWYYTGDEQWRGTSKADENGCEGCCWYDVKSWKENFNNYLHLSLSEQ